MGKAIIKQNRLIFDGTTKEDSVFFRQKEFEVPLDAIKIIGLKYGMFLDDDYVVIIFISQSNKKYFLGYEDFDQSGINLLNESFAMDLCNTIALRFEHEIDQFKSKILYPKELAGKPIFKDRNLFTGLYLMLGKLFLQLHYADGLLTKEVKYLKKNN